MCVCVSMTPQYYVCVMHLLMLPCVQVKFVMSDETTLEDLLALNLHEVEDDVRNIVDKATKELSMEKTLKVSGLLADL